MNDTVTVLGVCKSDFENDGKTFKGYSIFYSFKSDRITGVGCSKQWVKALVFEDCPCSPSDVIEFVYNKYGKVAGIRII